MACFNNCYSPIITRPWSRVQNTCSFVSNVDQNGLVNVNGELVPVSLIYQKNEMINKGNVLQYKSNSSNLTKNQRYSKIATGKWTNRTTNWASQSMTGYTNPNNSSLKRIGNNNIAINPLSGAIIGSTTKSVSCPQTLTTTNDAIPQQVTSSDDNSNSTNSPPPTLPPPVPPSSSTSTVLPPTTENEDTDVPIVVQNGGNLICSSKENICTGEIIQNKSRGNCFPTTASDVPGNIQDLCWTNGDETFFPRKRYTMPNGGDKWPTNSLLSSSIKLYPPYITNTIDNTEIDQSTKQITIKWQISSLCLSPTNFNLYQNDILIQTIDASTFQFSVDILISGYYQYYIISENKFANTISDKSNLFGIQINL